MFDMALLVSDAPAAVAAAFTTNGVCAAPVKGVPGASQGVVNYGGGFRCGSDREVAWLSGRPDTEVGTGV
jgi:hypothetical protein